MYAKPEEVIKVVCRLVFLFVLFSRGQRIEGRFPAGNAFPYLQKGPSCAILHENRTTEAWQDRWERTQAFLILGSCQRSPASPERAILVDPSRRGGCGPLTTVVSAEFLGACAIPVCGPVWGGRPWKHASGLLPRLLTRPMACFWSSGRPSHAQRKKEKKFPRTFFFFFRLPANHGHGLWVVGCRIRLEPGYTL